MNLWYEEEKRRKRPDQIREEATVLNDRCGAHDGAAVRELGKQVVAGEDVIVPASTGC